MKRIYLIASLVAHTGILAGVYYLGVLLPNRADENVQIAQSAARTADLAGRRRLDEINAMREALERSLGKEPGAPPSTSLSLKAQADELEKRISELDHEAKALELANLKHISIAEASKQLPPATPSEPAPHETSEHRLTRLEKHGQQAIEQRRAQLARGEHGISIHSAPRGMRDGAAHDNGMFDNGAAPGSAATPPSADALRSMAQFSDQQTISDLRPITPAEAMHFSGKETKPVPSPGPGTLTKASGNRLGPQGQFADRIILSGWYIVGPFSGGGGYEGIARSYPPEQAVDLEATYRGKGGRALRWVLVPGARYPIIPPHPESDAIYYGYVEVMMDQDRDLTVWVGADDDAKLWLNDKLVWVSADSMKTWYRQDFRGMSKEISDWNLTEDKGRLHFRKGRNRLLFKLNNGLDALFFSLVLTR